MDFIKIWKAARRNSVPEVFIPMDGTEYSDESLPPISAELKLDEAAANVNDVNPSFLPQTGSDVAREWARASTASSVASAEIRTFQMGWFVIEIWPFVCCLRSTVWFFPYTAIVALSFEGLPSPELAEPGETGAFNFPPVQNAVVFPPKRRSGSAHGRSCSPEIPLCFQQQSNTLLAAKRDGCPLFSPGMTLLSFRWKSEFFKTFFTHYSIFSMKCFFSNKFCLFFTDFFNIHFFIHQFFTNSLPIPYQVFKICHFICNLSTKLLFIHLLIDWLIDWLIDGWIDEY